MFKITNILRIFCNFLGNSVYFVCSSKVVTGEKEGKKGGLKTGYRKRIWGPKSVYGNSRGVSNTITEENKVLNYGYGSKLGFQKWLQKKTLFQQEKGSLTIMNSPKGCGLQAELDSIILSAHGSATPPQL